MALLMEAGVSFDPVNVRVGGSLAHMPGADRVTDLSEQLRFLHRYREPCGASFQRKDDVIAEGCR
jgi:hypothetical protein